MDKLIAAGHAGNTDGAWSAAEGFHARTIKGDEEMEDTRKLLKEPELKVICVERTDIAPAQKEKTKKKTHKSGDGYKDRIIAGEAILIMAMAILFYIAQAGPIF